MRARPLLETSRLFWFDGDQARWRGCSVKVLEAHGNLDVIAVCIQVDEIHGIASGHAHPDAVAVRGHAAAQGFRSSGMELRRAGVGAVLYGKDFVDSDGQNSSVSSIRRHQELPRG